MNRRDFLAAAAALAAGPAWAGDSPAPSAPPLKIGQIGTGHAHASGKMAALRSLKDVWEVVGVVAPASAAGGAAYRGLPVLTEAELLGNADVKAVAVETRVEDVNHGRPRHNGIERPLIRLAPLFENSP